MTNVSTVDISRFSISDADFEQSFATLLGREPMLDSAVEKTVREILQQVQAQGDTALLRYTEKFDRISVGSVAELQVDPARLQQARDTVPDDQLQALIYATDRIRQYHQKQKQDSWSYQDEEGTTLGQQITALQRVGLYVPGGKASYPSSVLMNAIPAKIAGVDELIMVVPAPDGELSDLVLAAAAIAGVDQVFTIGGAQAIAALAFGTESVPKVDKIVGPGNIYVATAKRLVFGQVDIDMVAGPSEIVIVCDGKTDPAWIAMDLFSQAEHDELAQSILISLDAEFSEQVRQQIGILLPEMERQDIIRTSLENRGALITVNDMAEAIDLVNRIAPEHLELSVDNAEKVASAVRHAGAIFMGRYTAEALGDYCAGPNHVLPTSGTARFSSPLGVYDFQKRTSLIQCSEQSASKLGQTASVLARGESLTAHARSAEYRIKD